MQLGKIWAM
jgi:hypothetical protein